MNAGKIVIRIESVLAPFHPYTGSILLYFCLVYSEWHNENVHFNVSYGLRVTLPVLIIPPKVREKLSGGFLSSLPIYTVTVTEDSAVAVPSVVNRFSDTITYIIRLKLKLKERTLPQERGCRPWHHASDPMASSSCLPL